MLHWSRFLSESTACYKASEQVFCDESKEIEAYPCIFTKSSSIDLAVYDSDTILDASVEFI